jgi:hypothetical protein
VFAAGIEKFEEALDDGVEVWEEGVSFDALAEVYEGGCGVGVDSG